jgi:ubiquinone/menaquinone biosynthesis C-methylase UbiE
VHNLAIMLGDDWMWQAWGELMHSVKTGAAAHDKVQGMGTFEFFQQNEKAGKVFNRAMTNISQMVVPAIVEAYDFSGVGKLVDIAGGHGFLLAGILKANPDVQGILFDLPYVIENAGELLESEGVATRTEKVSGDFFESVPAGADAYLMKHIIHDWDDERSIKILRNINRAMNENGKVLIVEMVVPEGSEPSQSKMLDIQMLVMEGGKERTEKEYRKLLDAANFRLTRIVPTRSPFSIVEAVEN